MGPWNSPLGHSSNLTKRVEVCHLVENSVSCGLEVTEPLARLAPTAALVPIVLLRVEVVLCARIREKQRA